MSANRDLQGAMFIAGVAAAGAGEPFRASDPATALPLEPAYAEASPAQLDASATAAAEAFRTFRATTAEARAVLLRTIADRLDAAPGLVHRVCAETGILRERVLAERTRTSNQLRVFADYVVEGSYQGLRIDTGDQDRSPLPKPDLRHRFVPVGPVAVWGASNFPLAFSVAGGDTASALAAGCPVVVKAHEAHPGTSEIVGRIISESVADLDLPRGTFSMLHGRSPELSRALASHPAIAAIGFTGSRQAGLALLAAAQSRPIPIPVFAEMASVNPVFVFPGALATRAAEIGGGLIWSVLTGMGQLCTSPGLVFVPDTDDTPTLLGAAAAAIDITDAGCMLTPRIAEAFAAGVARIAAVPGVRLVARATEGSEAVARCAPTLFETDLDTFLAHQELLSAEVFGSVTMVVRVREVADFDAVIAGLEGQLTATLHVEPEDYARAQPVVERLELLAGRLVFNGWSTGLEVNDAVVHGGPFPATSAPGTTSVGTRAIERFLRPVAYQNAPRPLLPNALHDSAAGIWRRVDGRFTDG